MDLRNISYVDEEFHQQIYPRCQPNVGDVLLTKDGASTGNVTLNTVDQPFSLLSSVCLIKTKTDVLAPAFLSYFIQSPNGLQSLIGQMTGTAIKRIILQDIKRAVIPIPPLPEQQRILSILDEAFEGIATAKEIAEKNLQNARAIFDSYLDGVLSTTTEGSVETTLGRVVDLLPGYAFSSEGYKLSTDGVRLLRGDNIMQGYFRWEDVKRWPSEEFDTYKKFQLHQGDVILAMDRPWVKAGLKRAQVSEADLPCLLVQRTARLRCKAQLNIDFLFHLTGSQKFSEYLLGLQTGLGVPHISGGQIEAFGFSLPTINEQGKLSQRLNSVHQDTEKLESIYQQKIKALDDLWKSLLDQAFSGNL